MRPNDPVELDQVAFPQGHRGILDLRRQLVVGNRGMGKTFWTHALTNPDVRRKVAENYSYPALTKTKAVIGFNGSDKDVPPTPTREDIKEAHEKGCDPELIWKATILRAVQWLHQDKISGANLPSLAEAIQQLRDKPRMYAEELSRIDDTIARSGENENYLLIFDALDLLHGNWKSIRTLTKGLLIVVLGLRSFRNIHAKVFIRVDQFADTEIFHFPDSSKLSNESVDLAWRPEELYGLLFFELLRESSAATVLKELAQRLNAESALPLSGRLAASPEKQTLLVNAIAGEFMGSSEKRGRVYTWVPLHLSDAANNCSPRTFLNAWKSASEHTPVSPNLAVDFRGLIEGVRKASTDRLRELGEDYPWISWALAPLQYDFVPIEKRQLFASWETSKVVERILDWVETGGKLAPIGVISERTPDALLKAMISIAVMEDRPNGKINVPDIFRVEAKILRKGGVAVPRKK
jgi:hypothetical protein